MTGRRFRQLLLLAAVGALAYWIYKDQPSVAGMVDKITGPLFGSKAAVKSSETNRVLEDAGTVVADQGTDVPVVPLHEGMTFQEVSDLLGKPDSIEAEKKDKVTRITWAYRSPRRVLVFQDGRVISIAIR